MKIYRPLALAAVLVMLGCQTPMMTSTPKVAVSYGSLQWSSDADLAVMLDFRALLQGYKLQATSTVGPVASIEAKVTGDNIVGEIDAPVVAVVDCPSGVATLNFDHLPAGKVHVVVNAFDANHNLISYGGADAQIVPGQVATVAVNCSAADGKLVVTFNCPLLCGPSTAPSATPTPGPSATPTATPTPTPSPADPRALANWVTGFNVDERGYLYLFGTSINVPPDYHTYAGIGRLVEIPPSLTVPQAALFTGFDPITEGEIENDVLHSVTTNGAAYGNEVALAYNLLDGSSLPVPNVAVVSALFRWSFRANTLRQGEYIEATGGSNTGTEGLYMLWGSNHINSGSYCGAGFLYTDGICGNNEPNETYGYANSRPESLSWASGSDALIWSSATGIYRLPWGSTTRQTVASNTAYGMTLATPDASKIFFTTFNDNKLYLLTQVPGGNPTVEVAGTFDAGSLAYRVEKGADGNFYVMTTLGTGITASGETVFDVMGGYNKYKVFKLALDANFHVTGYQTLVDTTH
jgi:hypothetical protein